MKRYVLLVFVLNILLISLESQSLKSPDDFLGYELGTQFTFHHRTVEYFKYVAENSNYAEYFNYGYSYEGRPLGVCIISSEENLKNLEQYRKNNLIKAGLLLAEFSGKQIPIIWLGYNVHGNEAAGMETSMKVLYSLISKSYQGADEWLKSFIIIIDPCQNPDGHELYVTRYKNAQSLDNNPNKETWEHNQPWPSARFNHYGFDLNRDWTWQTQIETRQRLNFYKQYMPHVHADFHEMGAESTFFFAPGAEPLHEVITPWQREFHKLIGIGNSKLFNEKFRLYFTKEHYDLFCPSFGDTWPLFNGAIGFTYEQSGGGIAGLSYLQESGDTLTLKHRIEGHFLASMATLKVSFENQEKLISGFNQFYEEGIKNPPFKYKSYIIKGSNEPSAKEALFELLDMNQIAYSYAGITGKRIKGFDYYENKEGEGTIEKGDILVSAYQPMSRFVNVLFKPDSKASDSVSYDLTAWALPYVFNLKAFALTEKITPAVGKVKSEYAANVVNLEKPYAYIADYMGFNEIKFMAELLKKDIKIRYSIKPFSQNGKIFNRGSIIIARGDNNGLKDKFDLIVDEAANKTNVKLYSSNTGLMDTGKDMGSEYSPLKKKPVVGLLCGDGISAGSVGSIWYFFERELSFPINLIHTRNREKPDFSKFDVIILCSGNYTQQEKLLKEFVKKGGRIIAIESAISLFSEDTSTNLHKAVIMRSSELKTTEKKDGNESFSLLKKFEDENRSDYSLISAGSIYKVKTDESNPFAFGMGKYYFMMKRKEGYPFLSNGYNIGYILDKEPVSGFAGYKFQEKIKNTLVVGSEKMGSGEIIYISDDPYYRAFWKTGRILLGNCIFR